MYSRLYLNNARNCLRFFLRESNIKEIWCPFQTCNVLFKAIRAENVRIRFYHIDENFYPTEKFKQNDYIIYPNYFGICDTQSEQLAKNYPNFIYDAAQSLFSKPLGLASIYSPRKFLPVADGGILLAKQKIMLPDLVREEEVEKFIINKKDYEYEKFLKNELRFNRTNEIKLISQKSMDILSSTDFNTLLKTRIKRFRELHEKYRKYNELHIDENISSPMVYPLKTKNNEIINELLKTDILFLQYDYLPDILPIPLLID